MTHSAPNNQQLLTGNEIMSGDTIDSNSALIAQRLGEQGLSNEAGCRESLQPATDIRRPVGFA